MSVILNYLHWLICKKKNILYIYICIKLILRAGKGNKNQCLITVCLDTITRLGSCSNHLVKPCLRTSHRRAETMKLPLLECPATDWAACWLRLLQISTSWLLWASDKVLQLWYTLKLVFLPGMFPFSHMVFTILASLFLPRPGSCTCRAAKFTTGLMDQVERGILIAPAGGRRWAYSL